MKIVLIGGNGFIGANLCEALIAKGHSVRVFGRSRRRRLCSPKVACQVEWCDGDFLNPVDVNNALNGCEIVFHLASSTLPQNSNENPAYDVETNVVASIHLLESAKQYGVRKVVFISSGGTIYGIPGEVPIPESHKTDPICAYGISKLAIEKYLALFHYHDGLDYTIIRLANPYGRYQDPFASQGVIAVFLNKVLNEETIEIWGDGSVRRDYIYISDAIEAMMKIIDYEGNEHIFNMGNGKGHSLNELIETIEATIGHPVKRRYRPGRPLDVPVNVLDITLFKDTFGWKPKTSLKNGIEQTLKFLKNNK